MSEKEATEESIAEALKDIMNPETGMRIKHCIRLLAKLIFNLQFDLDELKIRIFEAIEADNDEPEEDFYTPETDNDLKKIDVGPERFHNDFYA